MRREVLMILIESRRDIRVVFDCMRRRLRGVGDIIMACGLFEATVVPGWDLVTKLTVHPPPSGLRTQPSDKLARLPNPPREPEAMQTIRLIALILFTIKDSFEGPDDVQAVA